MSRGSVLFCFFQIHILGTKYSFLKLKRSQKLYRNWLFTSLLFFFLKPTLYINFRAKIERRHLKIRLEKEEQEKIQREGKEHYRVKKGKVDTKAEQEEVTNATGLSCTCAESSAQWEGVEAPQTSNPWEYITQFIDIKSTGARSSTHLSLNSSFGKG